MEILLLEDNMGAPSEKSKRVGRTDLDKEKVLEQKEYARTKQECQDKKRSQVFP